MFDNIIQNNGHIIALSGILVVFSGLVLISFVIHLFNKLFAEKSPVSENGSPVQPEPPQKRKPLFHKPIPPDHLTAIAVALEVYSKLHDNTLGSNIDFVQNTGQNQWKNTNKFRQRFSRS